MQQGPVDKTSAEDRQYARTERLSARVSLHRRYSTAPAAWPEFVGGHLALGPGQSVLEVGAGTGALWEDGRLQRLPAGVRLLLTDRSAAMCAVLAGRVGAYRRASRERQASRAAAVVHVGRVDARALPLADGSVDVLIANHMLYCVPDADRPAALAEAARVLTRGGRLVAATNGDGHLRQLTDLLRSAAADAPASQRRLIQDVTSAGSQTGFSIGNGPAQLTTVFADITVERYEDSLVVDEADPLLAYADSLVPHRHGRSDGSSTGLPVEVAARLAKLVNDRLARDGVVRIDKDVAVLTARRP